MKTTTTITTTKQQPASLLLLFVTFMVCLLIIAQVVVLGSSNNNVTTTTDTSQEGEGDNEAIIIGLLKSVDNNMITFAEGEDDEDDGDDDDDDDKEVEVEMEDSSKRPTSFAFSYKLYVPWNKFPWYNKVEAGQVITNEVLEYYLAITVLDCEQRQHNTNHRCSWIDVLIKGPCKQNEWFEFNCHKCYKNECSKIPQRLLKFVNQKIKTEYPWNDWLHLEWMEEPSIIPNPKIEEHDDDDTVVRV